MQLLEIKVQDSIVNENEMAFPKNFFFFFYHFIARKVKLQALKMLDDIREDNSFKLFVWSLDSELIVGRKSYNFSKSLCAHMTLVYTLHSVAVKLHLKFNCTSNLQLFFPFI